MDDDWNSFNPTKCRWFPDDFIRSFYSNTDSNCSSWNHGVGNDWSDEDVWDAMTDGMYGDYPGAGWDPEMFGY